MIYKISPDPSLLKRGIDKLMLGIIIIRLWKRGACHLHYPPLEKGVLAVIFTIPLWKGGMVVIIIFSLCKNGGLSSL
jgi:hypothetical protein